MAQSIQRSQDIYNLTVEANRIETTPQPTEVPAAQRSDIECHHDAIFIFLPANLISEDRNVTWRDEACGVFNNGTHLVGSIALTDCGTTVRLDNDTVSFTNALLVHKADVSVEAAAIADNNNNFLPDDEHVTYGEDYETVIPIECVYPRHSNVSSAYAPIRQHVRFYERRFGNLDLYMRQYEDDSFDTAIPESQYPHKVPLDNDVYIEVGMNFLSRDVHVKLERCIATATPSPADKNWRELIHSGCPVNGAQLLSSPDEQNVRFSFRAFDFRHNASGLVYVHCEATVCDWNEADCDMGCHVRARRSAVGGRTATRHLVSTGPLLVDSEHEQTGQQSRLPTAVAAASLLVAMAAVVMAVIGWRRPPHKYTVDL